jgi:hypothetical protein
MSSTTPAAAPVTKPNPNALLLFWRKAHTWVGLFIGLFVINYSSHRHLPQS